MKKQEKRIVALSVAVTLLGGWVTIGEAESRRVPECEDEINVVANGSCPDYVAQYLKCNETAPSNCARFPTGECTNNPGGGWTVFCTAVEFPS